MKRNTCILKAITILQIILVAFLAFLVWFFLLPILGDVHELGHVLAALVFGVRIIEITSGQVVTEPVKNPLVSLIIGLAGGFVQALLSTACFICLDLMWRKYLFVFVKKSRFIFLVVPFVLGTELALLTHSIFGVVNGIMEGFFTDFYAANSKNSLLWSSMYLASAIIVSIWLYKKRRMAWSLSASKLSSIRNAEKLWHMPLSLVQCNLMKIKKWGTTSLGCRLL